ncbi:TRAP transporter large permease [Xinfangfangia pollutisoli]|uniref:TRAP transporter large permease n=1 Tax=Xinfangfangia pollutisoli TaxID=2865960 RepID=UPI001CD4A118|nr:TRAP transporter large permease subunit [Xinfangfangia pollutisoli]
MEWWMLLWGALGLLLLIFLTGAPLFIGFFVMNLVGVWTMMGSRGATLAANSIFDSANMGSLTAIPLFLLMGEILTRSGAVDNLLRASDGLIGRLKGRQFVLTVLISIIFGALSGAAMAVAAMLGRSLYPVMRARNYDSRLSMGVIMAGASLAPIIPPSVLAVVIATMAGLSVSKMLVSGIGPALLCALLFLCYIFWRCHRDPGLAPERDADAGRISVLRALMLMAPFSVVIFSIMGLILLGITTPSEAAASGVLGAVLVAIVYRQFSMAMLWRALAGATSITAMIMVIVISSNLFGQLLAFSGATRQLVGFGQALADNPYLLLLAMQLFVLVMCLFVDPIALMLMLIPIYKPLVEAGGLDPLWFWTIVLLNLTIGGMTPPFGYTLFAFKAASGAPLKEVYAASWPWVGLMLLVILAVVIFPPLALWIPSVTG